MVFFKKRTQSTYFVLLQCSSLPAVAAGVTPRAAGDVGPDTCQRGAPPVSCYSPPHFPESIGVIITSYTRYTIQSIHGMFGLG